MKEYLKQNLIERHNITCEDDHPEFVKIDVTEID
jgi:hypothetical protein